MSLEANRLKPHAEARRGLVEVIDRGVCLGVLLLWETRSAACKRLAGHSPLVVL